MGSLQEVLFLSHEGTCSLTHTLVPMPPYTVTSPTLIRVIQKHHCPFRRCLQKIASWEDTIVNCPPVMDDALSYHYQRYAPRIKNRKQGRSKKGAPQSEELTALHSCTHHRRHAKVRTYITPLPTEFHSGIQMETCP